MRAQISREPGGGIAQLPLERGADAIAALSCRGAYGKPVVEID